MNYYGYVIPAEDFGYVISLKQYIDDAAKLKEINVIKVARIACGCSNAPPKTSGVKTKKFLIHW